MWHPAPDIEYREGRHLAVARVRKDGLAQHRLSANHRKPIRRANGTGDYAVTERLLELDDDAACVV